MFRYVFGGAIKIPGRSYVDYLMPGIFAQTVSFGAINTAVGLAEDRGKGLLERLRSLPMSRGAVLGGRVLADTLRNFVIVLLMVAIGLLVGFRTHTNVLAVFAGIAVLVFFGVALASIFVLIGLSVPNGEAAQAAAFPLLAPLTFASSAFVDPASMPGWLEWWARRQPLSKTTEAAERAVGALAAFGAGRSRTDELAVTIPLRGGAATVRDVLNLLHDQGIEVGRIDLHEPTLDDVFISLTGAPTV